MNFFADQQAVGRIYPSILGMNFVFNVVLCAHNLNVCCSFTQMIVYLSFVDCAQSPPPLSSQAGPMLISLSSLISLLIVLGLFIVEIKLSTERWRLLPTQITMKTDESISNTDRRKEAALWHRHSYFCHWQMHR